MSTFSQIAAVDGTRTGSVALDSNGVAYMLVADGAQSGWTWSALPATQYTAPLVNVSATSAFNIMAIDSAGAAWLWNPVLSIWTALPAHP